jgi:hypothetical protein
MGLVKTLDGATLNAEELGREITVALSVPRSQIATRAQAALEVDGARNAAEHLAKLFSRGRDRERMALAQP